MDPTSSNSQKVLKFGGPDEVDPINLAPPIVVAQKSSLISLIGQTLNTMRLSGLKVDRGRKKRKKMQNKKNCIEVGVNEHNQAKGG